MIGPATVPAAGDREIVVTRLLPAPRALAFDAFTDREHVGRWWGPHGFTTTTHEMDVRPGGVWRFVMHGPDGTDYRNRIVYEEVARPERLVYQHDDDDDGASPRFRATVTFVEEAGGTRVTLRMRVATAEIREEMERFGAVEGGQQTLERLEAYLTAQ